MRSAKLLWLLLSTPAILCAWTPSNLVVQGQVQQALENEPSQAMNNWRWENCGIPDDVVQIKSISVLPDPPVPGKNLSVTTIGAAVREIEEGAYADVVVRLGLIILLKKRFDLCEEARKQKSAIQCPVKPGDYTLTESFLFPREVPPGKYQVQIRGYTNDDYDLACLNLFLELSPRRPGSPFFGST